MLVVFLLATSRSTVRSSLLIQTRSDSTQSYTTHTHAHRLMTAMMTTVLMMVVMHGDDDDGDGGDHHDADGDDNHV